jgi:hypothetical protein
MPRWPDGPLQRPDSVFRRIVLTTDALVPLIDQDPTTAVEVILSLLIEERQQNDEFAHQGRLEEVTGIHDVFEWFPPAPFHGPFLPLLQRHPQQGLDLIVRLTSFALERLTENSGSGQSAPTIRVSLRNTSVEWVADSRVYCWYRDYPPAPHAVVVALMALEQWLYNEVEAGRSIDWAVEQVLTRSSGLALPGVLLVVGKKLPALLLGPLRPLLSVPEIYHWDLRLAAEGGSHLMMGWWQSPRQLVDVVAKFHSMPHKRFALRDVTQHLLLNFPDTRQLFDDLRQEWQAQLAGIPEDDSHHDPLEWLIAQHDATNFRIDSQADGQRIWVFVPPEKLRLRSSTRQEAVETNLLLLSFPTRCRELLDAGKPLSQDEVTQLWETIQRIARIARPDEMEPGMAEPANSVCGGIAVLVNLHRDWVGASIEREQFCVDFLHHTIAQPPPRGQFDSERALSTWDWDSFCAETIPILWSERPQSLPFRNSAAHLAFAHHYRTAGRLMSSAASVRGRLGEDFGRLEHLMLLVAAARWRFRRVTLQEGDPDKFEVWTEQTIKSFVDGQLPSDLPPWVGLATSLPEKAGDSQWTPARNSADQPSIDIELVKHAFSWIPSLKDARDPEERTRWIGFWKEALACTFRMMRKPRDGEWENPGTPYDFDQWIMDRIALLVPQLNSAEEQRALWESILDLGVGAHHWIEDFLQEWFVRGLQEDPPSSRFLSIWKEMLEYAFVSPKWEPGQGWYKLQKLWCALMGMNPLIRSLWREAQRPVVSEMEPYFERWAGRFLGHPPYALEFARFLKQPAASVLLGNGLPWLSQASETHARFWKERDIQSEIAELLEISWREHEQLVRHSPTTFASFKLLLMRLAERQNPIALELQNKLAGT